MRPWLCVSTLLLLAGCAGSNIHERKDPFYQGQIRYSDPIVLHHTQWDLGSGGYISVVVERMQAHNASPQYDLKIRCGEHSGKLMDVPEGDSLLVLIDGRGSRYTSAGGSAGGQPAPGARKPEAPYILYDQVPPDDLQAMAKAKTVEFRITGTLHSVRGDFSDGDFKTLQAFVASEVKGGS